MKVLVFLIAVTLTASASLAADEDLLRPCDPVIAGRQPVPELYTRTAGRVALKILTRDELALKVTGAAKGTFDRIMARFDSGEISPREVSAVIDYEATAPDAQIVRKRSICKYQMPKDGQFPESDAIEVDGVVEGLRSLMKK